MSVSSKTKSAAAPPKDQPTLAASSTDKAMCAFYLFLAFFIPFILMFVAFAVAKVSPFGKNQILVTDLWHQYYPFLVDYHDKLTHGGSLLWTWKSGGGTNYLALMAYYLASPLNFLSVLVPPQFLREFLYVITCVKIGLAGMFFALFLRLTFKRRDVSITAFGIMYALCAFIMGYYWNVIWLDTVALLPLVIAGAVALLRDGKFKLYVIALALSVLANYYIGLFTCIFVFLVCIGYTLVEYKGWRHTLVNFLKALGCSLMGVMMSAVLTLPAYFALGHTQSSDNAFPANFAINIGSSADLAGVLEGIGKTISNSVAFVQPTAKEGLPNIYCGVFVVFLAILFFFCSKIKKRERLICGLLLGFFMLSFIVRQLDFIWHGFHFPNMLPHRFSFLYSFVLIYMAFRVFMNIDSVKVSSVIAAICGFTVYLGVASLYYDNSSAKLSALFEVSGDGMTSPDPVLMSALFGGVIAAWVLLYALRDRISPMIAAIISAAIGIGAMIFVVAKADFFTAPLRQLNQEYNPTGFIVIVVVIFLLVTAGVFVLLFSNQFNAGNKQIKPLLGAVLLALALFEGLFSAATGVRTVSTTDGSYYPLGTTDTLAMVDVVNEREKDNIDLPRTEVNKYYTLNDNALIGVDGISMFNSMVNARTTDFMEKFGLCGWIASNRFTYQESSPYTNMMLNLKYLIAPYGAHLDPDHMAPLSSSGTVKLMENKYYIPMGFMTDEALLEYNVENLQANQPIENQNLFFRLSTGIDGDIYEKIGYTDFNISENAALSESSEGLFSYSSSSSSETYEINYTAPKAGVAVAYYDTYYAENVSLKINGAESISYYIKRPFIMMIGDVSEGDVITCSSSITGSSSGTINCKVAIMNEELFLQAYNKYKTSVMTASKVTDDSISGNITAAEDGLFYTSISYVEGWKAYVDGKEVEITPVGDCMLAFPLSKGSHIIDLRYIPEGFVSGLIITIAALLLFIGLIVLSCLKKNPVKKFFDDFVAEDFKKPEPAEASALEGAGGAAIAYMTSTPAEEPPQEPAAAPESAAPGEDAPEAPAEDVPAGDSSATAGEPSADDRQI